MSDRSGLLLARSGGAVRAWFGGVLSATGPAPTGPPTGPAAGDQNGRHDDVAYLLRQLVPERGFSFELRWLAGGGRLQAFLLGRVQAATEAAARAAAERAWQRLAALPRSVRAERIGDPARIAAALAPFEPGPGGLATIDKYVIPAPGAGSGYLAVQPLHPSPRSWSPLLATLAGSAEPVMLTVGLEPIRLAPDYAAALLRVADGYAGLARQRFMPAGLYSGGRVVPPTPGALDAELLYRDAARRYRDAAFRIRIAVAAAALDHGLLELAGATISPPAGPDAPAGGVPRPEHGTYAVHRPGRREAAALGAALSALDVPPRPRLATSGPPGHGGISMPADLADPGEAAAAFRLSPLADEAARSTGPAAVRVFVSYRWRNWPSARMLMPALTARFGADRVFLDAEAIRGGELVQERIFGALSDAAVMLVVIDRDWLTIAGQGGARRLDDPDDWVRQEIRYALARGLHIIPVLIGDARRPEAAELPAEIAVLARRKAVELRQASASADIERLLADVEAARRHGVGPS